MFNRQLTVNGEPKPSQQFNGLLMAFNGESEKEEWSINRN